MHTACIADDSVSAHFSCTPTQDAQKRYHSKNCDTEAAAQVWREIRTAQGKAKCTLCKLEISAPCAS